MPIATIPDETQVFDLETLPGGYVTLRRMTFGEKTRRQEIAFEMSITQDRRQSRTRRNTTKTDINNMQRAVTEYEFATCIVDHNLENDGGRLDFRIPKHVHSLMPRIGEEVSDLIVEYNGFDSDEADDYSDLKGE